MASIRTLNTAEITYNSTYPSVGYAATLAALGPSAATPCAASSTNACLIDGVYSTFPNCIRSA
ncbi:MAG TPA: hypothetical protein VMB19_08870 [Silvibacterium sp.]|nr:hypothetical protein [Silvibacterium sp.]